MTHSPIYKFLGLTDERVQFDEYLFRHEQSRKEIPLDHQCERDRSGSPIGFDASGIAFFSLQAYLAGRGRDASDLASHAIDLYEEFFFGDWRDTFPSGNYRDLPPDRVYQDINGTWARYLTDCFLWCSVLGDWDRLLRFAEYPRDDIKLDIDQSPENRAWLLLLAGAVRGRPTAELQPFHDTIMNGKRKREKLLYRVLEGIVDDETGEAASGCLREYATYYRTAEFPKDLLDKKVAYDASFLVHYAEYLDVPIEVPEKLKLHIVRLDPEEATPAL